MLRSYTALGVFIIFSAIVFGPLFAHPGFNWVANTTSQQAGQMVQGAWLMRLGFVAFGLGVLLDALPDLRRGQYENGLFVFFGVSMVLVAVFSHKPLDPTLFFDATDDFLHSVFATLMGFAYGIGVAWRMVRMRQKLDIVFSAIAAMSSIILPLAMWQLPEIAGLLQRLMFFISFVWLVLYLPPRSTSYAT